MSKKFAEYSQFDLSKVNKDVKAVLRLYFLKDLHQLTVCRVFTT